MALITSDYSPSAAVVPTLTRKTWLKNPVNPAINASVPVENASLDITRHKQRSVRRPLGRTLPVVLRGANRGEAFTVTYTSIGEAAWLALIALIDSEATLLLQTPQRQWYVDVSGDVSDYEDLWETTDETYRRITIPFTQVDIP